MILGVPLGHAVCKVAQRYQMVEQKGENPTWRRQINKRISCFRLRWLFRAAQRGLGRICFGGPLLSRPLGWVGLCDCSFGGHQVLLSSTESLGGVPNKSLGRALEWWPDLGVSAPQGGGGKLSDYEKLRGARMEVNTEFLGGLGLA